MKQEAEKPADLVKLARALADPNRMRILNFIRTDKLCVCQIVKVLGLAPSTVSAHLAVLEEAGLLVARKQGHWIYVQRPGRSAPRPVREALRWLDRHLEKDPKARQDRREAIQAMRLGAEKVCRIYQCRKTKPAAARRKKGRPRITGLGGLSFGEL